MKYFEPLMWAFAPQVRSQDAASVKCAAHRDGEAAERGYINASGTSCCMLYCPACAAADTESALAWYVVPVLV